MMNTEYDKEFFFDIDAYLIEAYPKMNMATRRSICFLALQELDEEGLEEVVDDVVANYAIEQIGYRDPEEDDDEDE
jgi:hypothetical protein